MSSFFYSYLKLQDFFGIIYIMFIDIVCYIQNNDYKFKIVYTTKKFKFAVFIRTKENKWLAGVSDFPNYSLNKLKESEFLLLQI